MDPEGHRTFMKPLINHTKNALSNKTQTRLNLWSCLQVVSVLSVHTNDSTRTWDSCCPVKSMPLPIAQIQKLLQR